jgi:hypothetical protein
MGAPVAKQRHLFTRRWRAVQPRAPSEFQIQVALIARLRLQCRPNILYFHCPNGELRDKRAAAKLKAMGVLPGVADLQFIFPVAQPNLFLELKARRRKLSSDQDAFRSRVRSAGHHYEMADNIDDAVRILVKYNVLPASQ